jgi:16S rRNA (adenine1518-N6/adenine1519-N6)-dimethyltransferase
VANLPYNVAVPVLLHLMALLPTLRHGLVMVQSEVADRLAAQPGSRTYGVPSVKAAWFAKVRRAGAVGRNVFWPAPNVDSGLVAWEHREPPAVSVSREEVFAVVDAAFAQRRKMLRSTLRGYAGSAEAAEAALALAGVARTARGESLGLEEFARIAEGLAEARR